VEQVPTEPVTLQALQDPPQAVLQQTPSTQLPDEHSLEAVHVELLAFLGTQVVPLQ
jgi:hypothetical protein